MQTGASGDYWGERRKTKSPGLSAALIESLTAQRSAALAAELQQRPDVALVAVVHAFALSAHRGEGPRERQGALRCVGHRPTRSSASKGSKAFDAAWSRRARSGAGRSRRRGCALGRGALSRSKAVLLESFWRSWCRRRP